MLLRQLRFLLLRVRMLIFRYFLIFIIAAFFRFFSREDAFDWFTLLYAVTFSGQRLLIFSRCRFDFFIFDFFWNAIDGSHYAIFDFLRFSFSSDVADYISCEATPLFLDYAVEVDVTFLIFIFDFRLLSWRWFLSIDCRHFILLFHYYFSMPVWADYFFIIFHWLMTWKIFLSRFSSCKIFSVSYEVTDFLRQRVCAWFPLSFDT